MNDKDHAALEALLRVNRFGEEHSGAFAPGSNAAAEFAAAAKFTAFSMPATFVADLQADVDTIKGKKGEQTDDRTGDVGETALTRTQIRQARELIADLNTSVRNKFRTDPEVLAEWSTASRIHRTGRRRNDDTPPPQPPVV